MCIEAGINKKWIIIVSILSMTYNQLFVVPLSLALPWQSNCNHLAQSVHPYLVEGLSSFQPQSDTPCQVSHCIPYYLVIKNLSIWNGKSFRIAHTLILSSDWSQNHILLNLKFSPIKILIFCFHPLRHLMEKSINK